MAPSSNIHVARPTFQQAERSPVSFPQWLLFPVDIRLKVFEELYQGYNNHMGQATSSKKTLTRYATVCREWQAVFEKHVYRRLVLDESCLDSFDQIVRRQRCLVKYIWLRIKLDNYDCSSCMEFEITRKRREMDDLHVSRAITRLLHILSVWDGYDAGTSGGLTLEISVFSPSDTQHVFKGDLHFGPEPFDALETNEQERTPTHDPKHGWYHGRRLDRPPLEGLYQVYTTICPKFSEEEMPSVSIIKCLVLRRQTRRLLDSKFLQAVFRSLPKLTSIIYETWRQFFRFPGYHRDPRFQEVISASLPETLKQLVIFEDFNEDYNIINCFHYITRDWPYRPELIRTPSPAIAGALAHRSLTLETICASYIIDAKDFFEACKSHHAWDELKTLSLTSKSLPLVKPSESSVNNLLLAAGNAALKMPNIRVIEIWNGLKHHACAFRYQVQETSASIVWYGTWDLVFDPDMVEVWKKVASRNTRHELSILAAQILDKQSIKSHADAIRVLKLSHVLHSISLEQIARESKHYFFQRQDESLRGRT